MIIPVYGRGCIERAAAEILNHIIREQRPFSNAIEYLMPHEVEDLVRESAAIIRRDAQIPTEEEINVTTEWFYSQGWKECLEQQQKLREEAWSYV